MSSPRMALPSRQLVGIVLLGIILAGGLWFGAYGSVDVRAAKFIEIANDAQERALTLRALALANGSDVAPADAAIALGNTSLAAATAAYSADPPDYATAATEAREAAVSFRAALRLLGEEIGDEALADPEAGHGLLEAIANHRRRLNRLNGTIAAIEATDAGPLPVATQAQLAQTHDELMAAEAEFATAEAFLYASPSDVPSATTHITTGLKHLQGAFASLRGVTDWTDAWKAHLNLLEPLLREIDDFQEEIDAASADGKDTAAVQAKLDQARDLYSDAEALLPADDRRVFLEVVKELRKLLAELRSDLARL